MGSKIIAIVGESGTGKSTSISTLDSKETYIINVAGKELPFKGSNSLYNTENKNYYEPTNSIDVLNKLKIISEKAPHIKEVILEDANYLMSFSLVQKALETGYGKFSILARDTVNLIQEAKKLRDDLIIYYFTHSEEVKDGEDIIGYKIKTCGKMIDNQVVMEGLFSTILYTDVECKADTCNYNFITGICGKKKGKSPLGMFDSLKIPNDLKLVSTAIREYYK